MSLKQSRATPPNSFAVQVRRLNSYLLWRATRELWILCADRRARFEGKGRFQQYLQSIPVHVITHPAAAFLGLKSLLAGRS